MMNEDEHRRAPEVSEALRGALRSARRVTVLTGAGISAPSGIPTFRDPHDGLWARFDPSELATPQAFARNPGRVWSWYAGRRRAMADAEPNAAHAALRQMERNVERLVVLTQNIDGLHTASGSRDVVELHGNIFRARCSQCDRPWRHGASGSSTELDEVAAGSQRGEPVGPMPEPERRFPPPTCEACGGHVRPDVVWFGEQLDPRRLNRAFDASADCDVFLSVGTSSTVEPAASLGFLALESGATLVEVNPDETPLTRWAHHAVSSEAHIALPSIVAAAWPGDAARRRRDSGDGTTSERGEPKG